MSFRSINTDSGTSIRHHQQQQQRRRQHFQPRRNLYQRKRKQQKSLTCFFDVSSSSLGGEHDDQEGANENDIATAMTTATTRSSRKHISLQARGMKKKRKSVFGTCPICQSSSIPWHRLESHAATCEGGERRNKNKKEVDSSHINILSTTTTTNPDPTTATSLVYTTSKKIPAVGRNRNKNDENDEGDSYCHEHDNDNDNDDNNTSFVGTASFLPLSREPPIPGLFIYEDFLTIEEEEAILHELDHRTSNDEYLPWKPTTFNGKSYGKRWGVHCNLRDRRVDAPDHPLPRTIRQIVLPKLLQLVPLLKRQPPSSAVVSQTSTTATRSSSTVPSSMKDHETIISPSISAATLAGTDTKSRRETHSNDDGYDHFFNNVQQKQEESTAEAVEEQENHEKPVELERILKQQLKIFPNEANAIDYRKGQGHWLKSHVDDRQLSKEVIINLSLAGDCYMTFTNTKLKSNQTTNDNDFDKQQRYMTSSSSASTTGTVIDSSLTSTTLPPSPLPPRIKKVLLPRRCIQILTGPARYDYAHGIANDDLLSFRRVSITMRESPLTTTTINGTTTSRTTTTTTTTLKDNNPIVDYFMPLSKRKQQSQTKQQAE